MTGTESLFEALRRWRFRRKYGYRPTWPIPPADVARAAELARERGWKDIGK